MIFYIFLNGINFLVGRSIQGESLSARSLISHKLLETEKSQISKLFLTIQSVMFLRCNILLNFSGLHILSDLFLDFTFENPIRCCPVIPIFLQFFDSGRVHKKNRNKVIVTSRA